jgi:hypothetical protein
MDIDRNEYFSASDFGPQTEKIGFCQVMNLKFVFKRELPCAVVCGRVPSRVAAAGRVYVVCTSCVRRVCVVCTPCVRRVYVVCTLCVRRVYVVCT